MRRLREARELNIGVVLIGTIAVLVAAMFLFALAPPSISDGMTEWRLGLIIALMLMPMASLLLLVALRRLLDRLFGKNDA